VTLTHNPQTIWQEEGGLSRIQAKLYDPYEGAENRSDLVLFSENFDDTADVSIGEEGWYLDDMLALSPTQAIAVREAIEVYLGKGQETEAIEPTAQPSTGPAHWNAKHTFTNGKMDLLVEVDPFSTEAVPLWLLTDNYGEEISLNMERLTWLANLLPQIRHNYKQSMAGVLPMGGMA
jgi:hypothetical protein